MVWKLHHGFIYEFLWLALPLLALVVFLTGVGKRKSARIFSNDRLEFSPSWVQFVAWAIVVLYCIYGSADAFLRYRGTFSSFMFGFALGCSAIVFLQVFPGTIIVSKDDIRQEYWFWRNQYIRWDEIVEVNTGKKSRTITITGAKRATITHARNLPDRRRLLLEIKRHCGESLPPDFPREAIPLASEIPLDEK